MNNTKCAMCGAPHDDTGLDTSRVYICESCSNQDAEYIARRRAALNGRTYDSPIQEQEPPAPKKARQYKHCASVRTKKQYAMEMSSVIHGKYSPAQYIPMLGCTSQEFVRHIESQFQPGMSWDNYNWMGWHIDHYVPFSYFDCKNEKDMAACWNYRNLRPLWSKDNLDKGTSLPPDYETLAHIYAEIA